MKEMIIDWVEYILTPKNNTNDILVPYNIKISKWPSIHNWEHKLYYASWFWSWVVWSWVWDICTQYKLTPCKYKDLKPWDLFFINDYNNPDFWDLNWYAIKLKEWYQHWDDLDCVNNYITRRFYWKVEEL